MALPFCIKNYLNTKEGNYGNSNISPCKKKKSSKKKNPLKKPQILQDIIITLL